MKVYYETDYRWNGHTVRVRPGTKVTRVSGYGAFDTPTVAVACTPECVCGMTLSFDVMVAQLERKLEREA